MPVAQRYSLILFGITSGRVAVVAAETVRTVEPFAGPEVWYRLSCGWSSRGRCECWARRGRVKRRSRRVDDRAIDPIPNLQGSPGFYADATNEVFFDNLKVTPNQ
jgi:hypothetical protein